jgi:TPR repeat protein
MGVWYSGGKQWETLFVAKDVRGAHGRVRAMEERGVCGGTRVGTARWSFGDFRGAPLTVVKDRAQAAVADMPEASEFVSKAQEGDATAQCFLGCCYEHGWGVEADRTVAESWYLRAALQDHAEAQNNLGWYYESGWGGTKDLKRACEFYTKAAEQGNPVGQVRVWLDRVKVDHEGDALHHSPSTPLRQQTPRG